MFDELSARFEDAVKGLRGQDKISETNVDGALKEVRRALLEAMSVFRSLRILCLRCAAKPSALRWSGG